MKKKIIVLAGPTASGKSAIAMQLAKEKDGVIINADSCQIYNSMPIMCALPSEAEMRSVPHRLYGILESDQEFSVGHYLEAATKAIEEIFEQNKLPIIVGGTGLYIKSLIYGMAKIPEIDSNLRKDIRGKLESLGNDKFYLLLKELDPIAARKLHPNDTQRVSRAMEVKIHTGQSIFDLQKENESGKFPSSIYNIYILNPDRAFLYDNINARFDEMIKNGGIEEVKALFALNKLLVPTIAKASGVPELKAYLDGALSLETAIEKAKTSTRHYAKRQYTFFEHQFLDKTELCFSSRAQLAEALSLIG